LTTNQDGDAVPQVLIKLIYIPQEEPAKEKETERREYRQREQDNSESNNKYI
jgi:hypothetical protein